MAPNAFDQTTTCSPRVRYTTSTTSSNWDNTPTNYTGTYDSGSNYTVSIVDRPTEQQIKKIIKRMMDDMCKAGWSHYQTFYPQPKLQPISLRGVRLDGRGWANL